jgi:hypothetical protein
MSQNPHGFFHLVIFLTLSVVDVHAAQSAGEWTRANPEDAYRIYKRVTAKLDGPASTRRPKEVKLWPECTDFLEIMPLDETEASLANLATNVLRLERGLRWYPKAIWRAELASYEKAQLKLIGGGSDPDREKRQQLEARFSESLEYEIRKYRRKHPASPKIKPVLRCYPGSPPLLSFKTDATTIRYISVQAYEFCHERKIQLDFDSCGNWTNYAFTPTRIGWGRVHFYFSWPDGFSKEMTINMSSLEAGAQMEVKR